MTSTAVTATGRTGRAACGPDLDLDLDLRTVYVPYAGGALVGIVHAAPWLAEDLQQAETRTRWGIGAGWPGQPVFAEEPTAHAWVAWIREVAPGASVDGWTVQPVLVEVDHGAGLRRVHPVTAAGVRTFWRRPVPLLLEATRVYLAALATYLCEHVLPQLEHAYAALTRRELDERTLRQLAAVQQLLTDATDGLAGLTAGVSCPGRDCR